MKKHLLWLCTLLLAACGLALSAGAAETRVYVADGGTGDGTSASTPCGSLAAAVDALKGAGGTVVFVGDVTVSTQTTLPEQSGDLTFTAEGGARLVQKQRITFAKNTNDNVITFDLPVYAAASSPVAVFGSFNSITFTEKFTVAKAATGSGFWFYGGVYTAEAAKGGVNADYITELPYAITVKNGTFDRFSGGNLRSAGQCLVGAIAAPLTVTIEGGTFGTAGTYDVESNNQQYNGFSVSGQMILADDATLNISGGTFHAPIFMQGRLGLVAVQASRDSTLTASDKKYYSIDGNLKINISGGSFDGGMISAYQQQVSHAQVVRGNFDVTITGTPTFKAGTVLDATAVKSYAGGSTRATLTMPAAQSGVTVRRFDEVNGAAQNYTEPLRIVTIGDSITEGTGAADPTHNAYTARILERAEQEGMELVVSNFGVGASTVLPYNQIRHRDTLAGVLSLTEADSAYVLVALGTNDALIAGGTVGQRAHFEREYEALLRDYAALPDTTRVFTTSAIYRYTSNKEADIRAVSVIRPIQARVTRALAAEVPGKFTYIDLYALLLPDAVSDALFAGDKLHPDADGYKLYAAAVYNAIFGGVTEVENFYRTDIYVSAAGRLAGAGTAADPISSLPVAFGLADPDGDATIHIMGTVPYTKFVTPLGSGTLTFVGEGTDATLALNGDMIRLGAGARFDNLTLRRNTGIAYLALGWNNAEFTETVKTAGNFYMLCGNLLFEGNFAKTAADDAASAGSSADQTVTVNGGRYMFLVGGNYRLFGTSPFATYSGNLTLHIGAGATVAANGMNGFAGQNYLTGSVHATVAGTLSGNFRDYAVHG